MLQEKARKYKAARRRKYHIRNKMLGTAERPRLSVFRSNRHMYAQLIDDVSGVTLASASTMSKDLRDQVKVKSNKEAASAVGQAIAKAALKVGIKTVSFDRGSSRYQGRTRTLAESARKAGLVF